MQLNISSKIRPYLIVRILIIVISCGMQRSVRTLAKQLPAAVQLGGAIVAAVEEDVEQQEAEHAKLWTEQEDVEEVANEVLTALSGDSDFMGIERLLNDVAGRGTFHKRRKILKYLYPLLIGVLIAKGVILPLILKMLTALSSTSFVMSKIALVVTGFLALKWIFSGSSGSYYEPAYGAQQRTTKLEIVHVPPSPAGAAIGKTYYGGGNSAYDMNWSDSNLSSAFDILPKYHRSKYIPLNGGMGPHHNYEGAYDGKPFL